MSIAQGAKSTPVHMGSMNHRFGIPMSIAQGAKSTPVHMGSKLYNEWLAAVKAGEISPTATASRNFIQKRLAGKGSQSWRKTPTRSDFDLISKAFFVRATLDPKSGIVRNPKYAEHLRNGRMVTNGLPKYLLAEI